MICVLWECNSIYEQQAPALKSLSLSLSKRQFVFDSSTFNIHTCSNCSYACRKTFEDDQKNFLKYFNGLYSWHGMYIVLMIQNVRQERQKTRMKRIFATRRVENFCVTCNREPTGEWQDDDSVKTFLLTIMQNRCRSHVKERRLFLRLQKHTRRKAIMFIIYCVSFNIQPEKKKL